MNIHHTLCAGALGFKALLGLLILEILKIWDFQEDSIRLWARNTISN